MWVIAEYQATALFSLKPATATASGGKTLLVPTPFAIKMALVDIGCRLLGRERTIEMWDWLGTSRIGLKPAPDVVVNNTFIKILRPPKKAKPNEPFQQTIAYREYAYLGGILGIALQVETNDQAEILRDLLMCINYLGKRGSFVQIDDVPIIEEELSSEYLVIGEMLSQYDIRSILTQLDDVGDGVSFEHIDIYSAKNMRLGQHRVLQHTVLPYELVSSSRSYTHYHLIETNP